MLKLSELIIDLKEERRRIPMQTAAALTVLGAEVQEKVQDMIGRHQSFWKDLAPSTVDQKQQKGWGRLGDPTSPLYATGEYQQSIEYRLKGRNAVEIFSNDPVSEYMEYGFMSRAGNFIAPRPVFLPAAKLVLRKWRSKNTLENFYLRSLR